jgi:mediator of RNA polymerase II transcription subunit 6
MDENPIQGRPGEFHLSSTGRREQQAKLAVPPAAAGGGVGSSFRSVSSVGSAGEAGGGKNSQTATKDSDGATLAVAAASVKPGKSPKPGAAPKPKRKKSKVGPLPST